MLACWDPRLAPGYAIHVLLLQMRTYVQFLAPMLSGSKLSCTSSFRRPRTSDFHRPLSAHKQPTHTHTLLREQKTAAQDSVEDFNRPSKNTNASQLSHRTENEVTLPNSFYKANIILLPQPDEDSKNKYVRTYTYITLKHSSDELTSIPGSWWERTNAQELVYKASSAGPCL